MLDPKKSIFRKQSLERLSSPEKLDQPIQIISSQDWIALSTLGGFVVLGLLWSIVGRIPITITGKGVLILSHHIVEVQAAREGSLKAVNMQVGQCVDKDYPLATFDLSKQDQQLQLLRRELAQLKRQDINARQLAQQRTALETATFQEKRLSLEQRLQNLRALTPTFQAKGLEVIAQQRQNIQKRLNDARKLAPVFQKRLERRQQFQKEGAISTDTVLQAQQDYIQARQTIAELDSQLKQLDLEETEIQQRYLDNLSQIKQLEAQRQELTPQTKRLEQEHLEAANIRTNQIQQVQQDIAQLEKQIKDDQKIASPEAGCILEVTSQPGQVVQPGTAIARMELPNLQIPQGNLMSVPNSSATILSITYFDAKDGKRIKPGMKMQITPDTVKRERFGGIISQVVYVSQFPVTQKGVTAVVTNPEVVAGLVPSGTAKIETVARLMVNEENPSGFQWSSSQGPNLDISPGTSTTVRVTVEERAPITFLIPLLRETMGI